MQLHTKSASIAIPLNIQAVQVRLHNAGVQSIETGQGYRSAINVCVVFIYALYVSHYYVHHIIKLHTNFNCTKLKFAQVNCPA